MEFQFREIRAKMAIDTGDPGHSQSLLGHKNRDTTERYVFPRFGQPVKSLRGGAIGSRSIYLAQGTKTFQDLDQQMHVRARIHLVVSERLR